MSKKKKNRAEEKEETLEEKIEEAMEDAEQHPEAGEEEAPAGNKERGETTEDAPEGSEEKDGGKDPKDEKIAELNDRIVRQMAEFDNFRKRTDKEKSEMFSNGEKVVIEAILPVIDNFERAFDMAEGAGAEQKDPFMEGMEKVYRQLMDELEKLGVRPIEALGTDFDPNIHNAVMQEETEEYGSGKVCKELQKGYMLNDSVVRHSMVSVAQ